MVKKSSRISIIWVLFIISVLSLTINISISQISVSDPVVSANRSTLQNYTPCAPINITNDDELAIVATSGMGTVTNPYIISGWNITDSPTDGISITGTTKYFRVENCWIANSTYSGIHVINVAPGTATIIKNTCSNNGRGISLQGSGSSTVINNTCNNNSWTGILLGHSNSSVIANNTCISSVFSNIWIFVSSSSVIANNTCVNGNIELWYSGSSIIVNNTCKDSGTGIRIVSSNSSTVANNSSNNNYNGIYLLCSDFSMVANNTCTSNIRNGISLWDSDHNFVIWNIMFDNRDYGIGLFDGSDNNVIHHNSFIVNGQNTSQAYDNGTHNKWYDDTVLEGNYWSDYNGTGSYLIDGTAGAVDPYPNTRNRNLETLFSILIRIGLFLGILGVLAVIIFLSRRKKAFNG